MRPLKPCFTAAKGEALAALSQHAKKVKAKLITLEEISFAVNEITWQGTHFDLEPNFNLYTPLIGSHQVENVTLAALAAQELEVPKEAIRKGVRDTQWFGRLEPINYKEHTFLLDCAHNPAALQALVKSLKDLKIKDILLIFGASKDKDIADMADVLKPFVREVILTNITKSPRAATPKELSKFWFIPKHLNTNPVRALECAVENSKKGELILVTGSIYLVSEVRGLLLKEQAEPWLRWQ